MLRGTGMLEEMGTGVPEVVSHGCHESWNKEEEPQTILYITNKRLNIYGDTKEIQTSKHHTAVVLGLPR